MQQSHHLLRRHGVQLPIELIEDLNQTGHRCLSLLAFSDKLTKIALLQQLDLAHHYFQAQAYLIAVGPLHVQRQGA